MLTDQDEISNLYRGPHRKLHSKFRFIWPGDYRGEDLSKSTNEKQELPVATMFINGWEIEDLLRMFATKFRFISQSGFREEYFLEIDQSETRIACGSHVCKWIKTK